MSQSDKIDYYFQEDGTSVAKLRGVSILVNNTNPGDKAMIRIAKVGRTYALAEVFNQK